MKIKVWKLVASLFLVVFGNWLMTSQVSAASSDDAVNYTRRDSEDYNYLPLILDPGSSTGNTGQLRDIISYNMAYDQGYEVQCAKPDWKITPQAYGAISEYFQLYDSPINLNSSAEYNVDFSGGKIPLFRGDEDLESTKKSSSFEGYFGVNDFDNNAGTTSDAGVANLLLTQAGQCVAKFENLQSIFGEGSICDKLENGDQCALDREIIGTDYTTQQLYEELEDIFSIKSVSDSEKTLNCGSIVGGWNNELFDYNLTQAQFQRDIEPAVDALQTMPLNLDILYRLAFLVISPQQNASDDGGIFSFLQTRAPQPNSSGNTLDARRHAPIVIGFKVPFVATNSILSLPNLRDSALLSAYSIRNVEHLQREQESILAQRSELLQNIEINKDSAPIINCNGMAQCSGSGNDQALFQALIDMVNGSEQACGNFLGAYEFAGDLGSPAEVSEDKTFREPYQTTVLPITNSAGFSWSLTINDTNYQNQLSRETLPVSAHLITPYGTNLEYIAESLQSFFTADAFEKLVQNNCIEDFNGQCGMIPEYFTFGSILADLDSDDASFTFSTGEEIDCEVEFSTPADIAACRIAQENQETRSVGATLTEQPREPLRILGAQIGWLIQKIQENLRTAGSEAQAYIAECKRAEDLFLGRCLGYQGQPGGSDSIVPNSCNDYKGITMELPTWDGLQKMVCSVAGGNANDAQLLWGLLQIEGGPMTRQVRAGATSMSCGDIILNTCGASQIFGVIVPACADQQACPGSAFAFEDGTAGQKYRDGITTDVACSVRGQMEYILQKRKGEMGEMRALYQSANGRQPTTDQLYYMMAGRNYGVKAEFLTKDACQGSPPVEGCSGANYCQCAMDTFTFSCN